MLQHSSIHKRGIPEYEYIVTETNTFNLDDLKTMYDYSWAFSTLQKFGLLEHVANYYKRTNKLKFMEFY